MIVYVSGKYSAPTEKERQGNTNLAVAAGVELEKRGYHAIIPHLSHYLDIRAKETGIVIDYETWMHHSLFLLSVCDAMLVISDSPGVQREIEFAKRHKIPIYYYTENIPLLSPLGNPIGYVDIC